jgi:hypothetical protein
MQKSVCEVLQLLISVGQDTELGELGSRCSLTGSVQAAVFRGLKPDITYTMKVSLTIRQSSCSVLFLHSHLVSVPESAQFSGLFIAFSDGQLLYEYDIFLVKIYFLKIL